jgi:hypothetical protein
VPTFNAAWPRNRNPHDRMTGGFHRLEKMRASLVNGLCGVQVKACSQTRWKFKPLFRSHTGSDLSLASTNIPPGWLIHFGAT